MENEELFAGESALDAQQQARGERPAAAVTKNTPMRIHTEPLLAGDGDLEEEWPRDDGQSDETDGRPRWRRPHVSVIPLWCTVAETIYLIAIVADYVAVAIWPAFHAGLWRPCRPKN
jgi:hypothetical protein